MRFVIAATAAAALLLAGCSGGADEKSDAGTVASGEVTAAGLAKQLDSGGFACTGFELNTDALAVKEDGLCMHTADDTVSITVYQDRKQLDDLLEAFSSFTSGHWVKGDAWAIYDLTSASDAEKVAQIVGGKVQ